MPPLQASGLGMDGIECSIGSPYIDLIPANDRAGFHRYRMVSLVRGGENHSFAGLETPFFFQSLFVQCYHPIGRGTEDDRIVRHQRSRSHFDPFTQFLTHEDTPGLILYHQQRVGGGNIHDISPYGWSSRTET